MTRYLFPLPRAVFGAAQCLDLFGVHSRVQGFMGGIDDNAQLRQDVAILQSDMQIALGDVLREKAQPQR